MWNIAIVLVLKLSFLSFLFKIIYRFQIFKIVGMQRYILGKEDFWAPLKNISLKIQTKSSYFNYTKNHPRLLKCY